MIITAQQSATRLIELCSKGDFEAAQKNLFSNDAISIEPNATPAFDKETKTLDAIIKKGKNFNSIVENRHCITISDPLIATNSFACIMTTDVTMEEGARMPMEELCVYEVKAGQVISQHSFM